MVPPQPYWADSPTVRASRLASISSRSVSPSPSLGRSGLFYGTDGLPNGSGPTIGTPPPNKALLPGQIFWIYLDASGQVQGPFDGIQMSGWFQAGWLPENLHLRRTQDKEWLTLDKLIQTLRQPNPFEAVLPPDAWDSAFPATRQWTPPTTDSTTYGTSYASPDQASSSVLGQTTWSQQSDPPKYPQEADPALDQHVSGILSDLAIDEPSDQTDLNPYTASGGIDAATLSSEPAAGGMGSMATPVKHDNFEPLVRTESQELPDQRSMNKPSPSTVPAPVPKTKAWGQPNEITSVSPRLSLKEIKEREMERKRDRTADQDSAAEAASSQADDVPPHLPADRKPESQSLPQPTWASRNASPNAAPKSIAEIRREQQAKKPVKAQQKGSYAAVLGGHSGTVVRPTVHKSQHVSPPAAPKAPSAWNTTDQAQGSQPPVSSPRRTIQQRQPNKTTASHVQPKKASPADELVQWAKVSFRQGLRRDVDHMELLEVFLSLPNTQDARDFISESIFSYATTLDGRRFAHEFLNRKKTAETSFRPGETWKTILRHFNPEMETDPSFKVVTKKRYKPIPRLDGMRI